ncbi:MAG TPA: DinB family protein [Caldisericia bacterium]|nr:DinB family protein [Caldisericia bacterium]HPF49663.1 DinB family protein [Caldisericia bacterium]HPI84564.1 DinB family protein [Caldisericia bacterium]HPQ93679.1 DinB family protein [Caldisericia bacterium]HRV74757.1 DinB family protein [Caldisericia bacterium]
MTKDDAISLLGWTRERLLRILEGLPDSFLDFKPNCEIPKSTKYNKPYSILSHIGWVENYWIQEKIRKSSIDKIHWAFRGKGVSDIVTELEYIRSETNNWLKNLEVEDLNIPYSSRAKTNISWIVYHVAEHEAHHLAQIDMLAGFAGIKTPWV